MSGLPAGVETVTVTSGEPLVLPDGTPYQGRLIFSGPGLATIAGQDVVLGGPVTVKLVDGMFSVTLVATDATGMSPTGWTYEVLGVFTNAPCWTRHLSLPKAAPEVVLADVVVPDPVTGQYSTLVDSAALLAKAQNLADLADKALARGNLGLGSAATKDTGTASGTVAAGDDSRITGAAQKAQNLADLVDKAAARTALGLGTSATKDVGTGTGTVAAGDDSRLGDSRTPKGPAGGDLGGTYPNPSVAKVNGVAVAGTPNAGDALVATDGTHAAWKPVSTSNPWVFDVTKYGAKGDGRVVHDGAVQVGVPTLTCATSAPFTPDMVNMVVLVQGVGTFGVTAWKTTFSSYISATQMGLAAAPPSTLSGAVTAFGTNNYTFIRQAAADADAYLQAGHPYAEVYTPPVGTFILDGPLDTSKYGNGLVPFGVYATTNSKKHLAFRSDASGALVRHWEQTVPQTSGATWLSFGFYSSTSAQLSDLNLNGNPGIISGPNEGTSNGLAYGASARFSNVQVTIENMAFLVPHTAYGITYGAANLYGCATAHVRNVSLATLGVVPGNDYTSPGTFATGLCVGFLMPAPGNNDLSLMENVSIQGGFTYGVFFSEHTLIDRIMVLYCWAALCPVGSYAGSVGSVHEMRVLGASVEACTHEVYIIGVGSEGVGPTVDIHLSTESSTPNIDGNGVGALMGSLGRMKLTGLFTRSGVSMSHPSGIEIIDGQSPRAIARKSASFAVSPIDRTLLCDTTAAGFTATLPAADVNPVEYTLRNTGTNVLTVATTGGQTIYTGSGAGTTAAVASGTSLRVQAAYTGSAWAWYAV